MNSITNASMVNHVNNYPSNTGLKLDQIKNTVIIGPLLVIKDPCVAGAGCSGSLDTSMGFLLIGNI
jgi:hypothetical protein